MVRLALVSVVLFSGCTLWFDSDDDPPVCALDAEGGAGQDIAPAPLRDPGDLTCDNYGGGPSCDPACGPCPELAAALAPIPPIPSYNYCGHICESYGESQCAASPECRVVKFAECVVGDIPCLTDFMGCFPVDTAPRTTACFQADAWECSRDSNCTALHSSADNCPEGDAYNCPREFELCIPEGSDPGECYAEAQCDSIAPPCPSGTTAGVLNGCWSGACIPTHLCNVLGA